jgi:hypothetical protein
MARISALLLVAAAAAGANAHSHDYMPGSETSGLNAMVREIYGGSKLREFVHQFLMEPLPDMVVGSAVSPVQSLPSGEYEQTFVSPPMVLMNGNIVNKWLPIDWPHGHIAIKAFSAEVAKSTDGAVPPTVACCGGAGVASREEVFMHHWTVNKWQLPAGLFKDIVKEGGLDYHLTLREKVGYIEFLAGAGLNSGANGPCWDSNLHLYFGIGNEVRTKTKEGRDAYEFPDPYGVEFDSTLMRKRGEFMVLNTHLIDIRNVSNKRACTECSCKELGTKGFLNVTEGGLTCCHSTYYDGGKCPIKPEAQTSMSNVTYYIRYTIKWRDFSPATTLPLEVITFDATDNNSYWGDLPFLPGGFKEDHQALKADADSWAIVNDGRSGDFDGKRACHIEWYVPPCKAGDSCLLNIKNSWEMPYPIDIVYLRNHFHAGGISMSTFTDSFNCTGHGTYDESQDLVDISTCSKDDGSNHGILKVKKGEMVHVESLYKQDHLPHYGVMSMSFVFAHIPKEQDVHV